MKKSALFGYSLLLVLLASLIVFADEPSLVRSQLVAINATQAEVVVYRLGRRQTVSFEQLELWNAIPADKHPQKFFYSSEVDFRVVFLEEGFAKIRDGVEVPIEFVNAQSRAQAQHLGMWAPATPQPVVNPPEPTPRTPQPDPAPVPPPAPTLPSWWAQAWQWLSGEKGKGFAVQVARSIILVVSSIGIYEFVGIIIRWRRRFRVDVVFFGQISVGKTWLWLRTLHPNISLESLRAQKPSKAAADKKLHRMPMGDYTMRPVFTDMPGSRPGAQLTQLVDRRRFWWLQNLIFPQKRVWVISLAPTIDNAATRVSPREQRAQRDHLLRQYGSLVLYEAALREPRTHKPALVIICITKSDLFADDELALKFGRPEHTEIRDVFADSVMRLETVCKEEHVPSTTIMTSALHGWGCQNFTDALRDAFYPPEIAR